MNTKNRKKLDKVPVPVLILEALEKICPVGASTGGQLVLVFSCHCLRSFSLLSRFHLNSEK